MSNKQAVLEQIVTLATQNGISASEIESAINGNKLENLSDKSGGSIAMRIFSILGGVFILAGVSAYIAMFWDEMNSATRVIITLGSGFVAYMLAVIFSSESRYLSSIVPLLLIAALLESFGLFVLIDEYFNNHTNNWRLVCLIVFGLMLVQQGLTFVSMRIPILLLTTLWFASSFFYIAFDMTGIAEELNTVIIGGSLLSITYGLRNSIYGRVLQLAYFFGSIMLFVGLFELLRNTPFETLYLAIAAFMIYISVLVNSTVLLIISVLSMLSYIGYYTAQHFVHSVGWPLALIVLGILFFIISAGALRIKKKYIS